MKKRCNEGNLTHFLTSHLKAERVSLKLSWPLINFIWIKCFQGSHSRQDVNTKYSSVTEIFCFQPGGRRQEVFGLSDCPRSVLQLPRKDLGSLSDWLTDCCDTERVQQRLLFTKSSPAFLLLSSEHLPWEYAECSNMAFGSNDIESQFLHPNFIDNFHQSWLSSALSGHTTSLGDLESRFSNDAQ